MGDDTATDSGSSPSSDDPVDSPSSVDSGRVSDDANGDDRAESDERGSDRDPGLVDQIAKGAGVGIVGRVASKGLSLVLEVLLTQFLGPSRYGLYVLGKSVTRIVQRFAQLGLQQGAIRYGSIHFENDDEDGLSSVVAASLLLSVVVSILAAAAVFALAGPLARVAFDDPSLAPVVRWFAFAIPFYVLLELAAAYFQAFKRIDREQLLTSAVRPVANLALVGGAFLLGYRLGGAVVGFVLTGLLSSAVGFVLLARLPDAPLGVPSAGETRAAARRLLAFSIPMMLISMSFLVATRTDRLMLGILDTSESVGIYNVAATVSLQFSVVISALIAIYKPIVADVSANRDDERIPELYNVVKKWASYGTLALFVVVAFFAGPILSVFGPSFTEARTVLYVLPLMYVGGAVFGPCGALLTMTGREKIEVVNGVLLVSLNVALNYLLIPIYGALGAAIAVVIAGTVVNVVQTAVVYVIFDFHPFDRQHLLLVGVMGVTVAGAVTLGRRLPILERAVACAAILAGCVALFYYQLDDAERDLIETALDSFE